MAVRPFDVNADGLYVYVPRGWAVLDIDAVKTCAEKAHSDQFVQAVCADHGVEPPSRGETLADPALLALCEAESTLRVASAVEFVHSLGGAVYACRTDGGGAHFYFRADPGRSVHQQYGSYDVRWASGGVRIPSVGLPGFTTLPEAMGGEADWADVLKRYPCHPAAKRADTRESGVISPQVRRAVALFEAAFDLALEEVPTQFQGPCPLCGGEDRFYVNWYGGRVKATCRRNEGHTKAELASLLEERRVVGEAADLEGFWDGLPALAAVRDAALQARCSPWAVLSDLLPLAASAYWAAELPDYAKMGSARLNFYTAAAGGSGAGKSTGHKVALRLMGRMPHDSEIMTDGTVQGVVDSFSAEEERAGEDGKPVTVTVFRGKGLLWRRDEIPADLHKTDGLLNELSKSAWADSGYYKANLSKRDRSARERVALPHGGYGLSLAWNGTPPKARQLVDDTGGVVQRFCFFDVRRDPWRALFDTTAALPEPLPRYAPADPRDTAPPSPAVSVAFNVEMDDEVRRRLAAERDHDPNPHILLMQVKAAALLALLSGSCVVGAEHLQAATMITAHRARAIQAIRWADRAERDAAAASAEVEWLVQLAGELDLASLPTTTGQFLGWFGQSRFRYAKRRFDMSRSEARILVCEEFGIELADDSDDEDV